MKLSISRGPGRFFLAVLVGYAIDYCVFAALVAQGTMVYLANAIAFVIGSTINTMLIRRFVFTDNRFSAITDVCLSLVSNAAIFLGGTAALWYLVEVWTVNPYLAKLMANGATFVTNYAIRVMFFRSK